MAAPEPHHRLHRPSRLLVAKDSTAVTTQPHIQGGGGVGWRPGVPHIILHSGDVTGALYFPPGYQPVEYIEPVARAGRPVPVASLRCGPYDNGGYSRYIPYYEPPETTNSGYPDIGYIEWVPADILSDGIQAQLEAQIGPLVVPDNHYFYERSGRTDQWWIGPSNAATLPATLEALADIDIRIVTITYGTSHWLDDHNEFTYDEFIQMYEEDTIDEFSQPHYDIAQYGAIYEDTWGGYDHIHYMGAAYAALTGAMIGEEVMSYGWDDGWNSVVRPDRWVTPTALDASSFADFLVPKLLQLADQISTDRRMDIALTIDSSGSFGSGQGIAARVFRDVIDRLRAEENDIFVAVSRFEEFAPISFYEAAESGWGRPFVLQYPLAPVNDEFSYNNMLLALSDDTPGGGGDTPETQLEAFYQLATGAGFHGMKDWEDWEGPIVMDIDGEVLVPKPDLAKGLPGEPMFRSGEAGVRGLPLGVSNSYNAVFNYLTSPTVGWTAEEAEKFLQAYSFDGFSIGLGYMYPGLSGDVPPYGGGARAARATALPGPEGKRVGQYDEQGPDR